MTRRRVGDLGSILRKRDDQWARTVSASANSLGSTTVADDMPVPDEVPPSPASYMAPMRPLLSYIPARALADPSSRTSVSRLVNHQMDRADTP
jgi:hypothetical protein